MTGIIKTLLFVIAFILFIILSWLIVIPDDLVRSKIEESFSSSARFNVSIKGLKKTPLFGIKADGLTIEMDKKEIIDIREPEARFNPLYLLKDGLSLSIRGKIDNGEVNGRLNLPDGLYLNINGIGLDSISYLKDTGFRGDGHLSGMINLKGNIINIIFEVSDLNIISTGEIFFPFADTFHRIQGAINIDGNNININSIGLEGEKGYARISGDIIKNDMRLSLELMPYHERLTQVELMLINKYEVSPGYYVIPLNNLLPAS